MKKFALLLLLSLTACAQTPGRIQSPTRQVMRFGGLEDQLATAVVHKDAAAMEALLADDFALRTARTGGAIMGRAEYVKARIGDHELRSFRIQGVDVRDYGDVAVVSFLYHQDATSAGSDLSGDFFITDIWKQTDNGWHLSARYSAGPGLGKSLAAKPTGKE